MPRLRGPEIEVADVTDLSEPRISLGEAAYRRLRGDIIACRLAPGQRLTEKQLAADTGFSLAPLRDALTRLDPEGLVRGEALRALAKTADDASLVETLLITGMEDPDPQVRALVVKTLAERGRAGADISQALVRALEDPNDEVKAATAAALAGRARLLRAALRPLSSRHGSAAPAAAEPPPLGPSPLR